MDGLQTETSARCAGCGAELVADARFCAKCGAAVADIPRPPTGAGAAPAGPPPSVYPAAGPGVVPPPPPGFSAPPPPPGSSVPSRPDEPFPQPHVLGAVVLTVFAPFISLIAALVMRNDESSPRRRDQLKSWAIASGLWLVFGGVAFIAFASSVVGGVSGSGGGECRGGVDMLTPPSYVSKSDGSWESHRPCVNGGERVKKLIHDPFAS